MTSAMYVSRPAATASSGWRRRSRVLGLGLILAVGLSACVEVLPRPAYEPEVSGRSGFYQSTYPNMVVVPGYPVYYNPSGNANYFFYDGLYWLYQGDRWLSSNWYNGPWAVRGSHYVPHCLLRVPVRYYRAPPRYFRGWRADEPPHWGEHWGHDWEDRHQGWRERDRWIAPPAPLPRYQESYAGNRYPRDREQQDAIRDRNYRYVPRDDMTRPQNPPPGRPSYLQQQQQLPQQQSQVQLHQVPAAPVMQPRQDEEHSNQSQVRRPPSTTPPQSQQVHGYRQATPKVPPKTQPDQQQHRESPPPARARPSHPAPQHPKVAPPPDESSSPPTRSKVRKSSPPDESADAEVDLR